MSLNLHNRHVDDQGAGEGEVLLEGVDAEMMEAEEAEEMGQDLFDSVVCKKIYEEPGQRGSAADFLLGEEIEGDPPGREEVEAGAQHLLEINDSNKCHSSSIESSPATIRPLQFLITPKLIARSRMTFSQQQKRRQQRRCQKQKRSLDVAPFAAPTEKRVE